MLKGAYHAVADLNLVLKLACEWHPLHFSVLKILGVVGVPRLIFAFPRSMLLLVLENSFVSVVVHHPCLVFRKLFFPIRSRQHLILTKKRFPINFRGTIRTAIWQLRSWVIINCRDISTDFTVPVER